jgi:hypothetical protein
MQFGRLLRLIAVALIAVAGTGLFASDAAANHAAGFHWARASNPFTVTLGNNLTTAQWSGYLANAAAAWSNSAVLDVAVAPGQGCTPTPDVVEVCNGDFGDSGWLGLAEVWVDKNGHVVQATISLNDPRFVPGTYNDYAKQHVLCQEIGHVLGLGHVHDAASFTCMDDVDSINDPDWVGPNAHDYDQLAQIYRHHDKVKAGRPVKVVGAHAAGDGPESVRDGGNGLTVYSWAFSE